MTREGDQWKPPVMQRWPVLIVFTVIALTVWSILAYSPESVWSSSRSPDQPGGGIYIPVEATVGVVRVPVSVVVFVTTKATSRGRRDLMRRQFERSLSLLEKKMGTETVRSVIIRYGVGKAAEAEVAEEAAQFGDMIFLDCPDADPNTSFYDVPSATTLKVLHGIAWAVETYTFDYFFRVGDDAFLRIDYFRELVSKGQFPKEKLVLGYIIFNMKLIDTTYHYPSGMGFVLSYDICNWLAMSSKLNLLMDTYPEDGMVGRWLLAIKTTKLHLPESFHDYEWHMCSDKSILIHKLPDEAWRRIDDNGQLNCI